MTTTRGYWGMMRPLRDTVALLMGIEIGRMGQEQRAAHGAAFVPVAALAKALVDKGVLTDSDIAAAVSGASSSDGSFWDPEPPDVPTGDTAGTWDTFPGEPFESGSNGTDATEINTAFGQGQVGDTLLSTDATLQFDSSTHAAGSLSVKSYTVGTHTRALATSVYDSSATWFTRFYFKAASPPSNNGVRILRTNNFDASTPVPFEIGLGGGDGVPIMLVGGIGRFGTSIPTICDGNWWRVEAGVYATALTPVCEIRLYTGTNLTGTTMTSGFLGDYDGTRIDSAFIGQPGSLITSGDTFTCYFDNVGFTSSGWIGP